MLGVLECGVTVRGGYCVSCSGEGDCVGEGGVYDVRVGEGGVYDVRVSECEGG